MNDATKQILVAVAAASAAALVTGLITNHFTKAATIESVAKGTTPLPADATPKVVTPNMPPQPVTPTSTPAPAPFQGGALEQQPGWISASWKAMGYQS